jgi:hypothetical protein
MNLSAVLSSPIASLREKVKEGRRERLRKSEWLLGERGIDHDRVDRSGPAQPYI